MSKFNHAPQLLAVSQIKTADVEVIPVFQEKSNEAVKKMHVGTGPFNKLLTRLGKTGHFNGAHRTSDFVRFGGNNKIENVAFIGMGTRQELTEERARIAGAILWNKISAEKCKQVKIDVEHFEDTQHYPSGITALGLLRAFAEGMDLASYKYHYKNTLKKTKATPIEVFFVTKNKVLQKEIQSDLEVVAHVGEAIGITREWSNLPPNIGTPVYYAAEAKKLAAEYGLKFRVLNEQQAAREKMGLFLAVGQGSTREGQIVVLEYNPKAVRKPKTVALVGKGITFDSGGISIKPSPKMEDMKHDMTGAATMMGALLLCAKLQVPNRVVGILAFTENMPDGNAVVPGAVITSRSGKTVEIANTDAEGRLILADALDFAHDFKPDVILDAATLTGAVSVALGKICAGILGNNQATIDAVIKAAEKNGERLWNLPLWDEYFDDMKSEYADMCNISNTAGAGTIRGGIFLKQFIKNNIPWAHLDIAATAWDLNHLPYCPRKGASGTYVRTIAQFVSDFR